METSLNHFSLYEQTVRKGTNGAVTVEGLLAAAAAGFVIGLAYVIVGLLTVECAHDVMWKQLLVIPVAAAAGLCGSLIDSLLGATLQFSGYCSLRKRVMNTSAMSHKVSFFINKMLSVPFKQLNRKLLGVSDRIYLLIKECRNNNHYMFVYCILYILYHMDVQRIPRMFTAEGIC